MNLVDVFNSLSQGGGLVFKAKDGKVYTLDQAQSKGIEGKIIEMDNSDDLKMIVFGKRRVGVKDMEALADIAGKSSKLYKAVYDSLSYLTQKKIG